MKANYITKRGGVFYFKKRIAGKVLFQSLRTGDRQLAARKAKLLAADLEARRWDRVFELRTRRELASIGEVLAVYEPAAARLQIKPRSAYDAARSLELVVRKGLGVASAEGVSARELTGLLARRFRDASLAAAGDEVERAKRSAASLLRQARSVFSLDAMQFYRDTGLVLPDVSGFRAERVFPKMAKLDYQPPSDAVLAATFAALPALARGSALERDMYRAICLAVGAGLRKSEITAARWDWFGVRDGRPVVRSEYVCKNRSAMDVPILSEWWERLQAARPESAIEGAAVLQGGAAAVFRAVGRWMGGLGWRTQKRIHEFRAYVGSQIAQKHGIVPASLFLRHGDISTTQRFYLRYLTLQDVEVKIG
jgi:integrase